jgi:prepilin-type N-terminal cleavage/methylation domain-containing protein
MLLSRIKVNAFTIIELLIVITLIGILMVVALVRYGPVAENARAAEAYSVLAQAAAGEKAYYVDNNAYASAFTSLDNFSVDPTSNNFNYSIDTGNACIKAAAKVTGSNDYYVCIVSGKRGVGASCTCP